MQFAPHLGWPALTERFSIELTAGPPAKWRLGWAGPEDGKDGDAKAPKEVRVGASVKASLKCVYLVDAHKNRVTDARWTGAATPAVTLEYSDGAGGLVEVAVPVKFKNNAKGGDGARWVVGNTAAWRGDPTSCKVTVDSRGKAAESEEATAEAADGGVDAAAVLAVVLPDTKRLKVLPGQPAQLVLR
jgi:hypothetical protein